MGECPWTSGGRSETQRGPVREDRQRPELPGASGGGSPSPGAPADPGPGSPASRLAASRRGECIPLVSSLPDGLLV